MAICNELNLTQIAATFYGLLATGMAFMVGRFGTVLQAVYALSGSISGPLFALFVMGVFLPFVNSRVRMRLMFRLLSLIDNILQGAIVGFLSGCSICLCIFIGLIYNPRPKLQLPVYTDECSAEIQQEFSNSSVLGQRFGQDSFDYEPE